MFDVKKNEMKNPDVISLPENQEKTSDLGIESGLEQARMKVEVFLEGVVSDIDQELEEFTKEPLVGISDEHIRNRLKEINRQATEFLGSVKIKIANGLRLFIAVSMLQGALDPGTAKGSVERYPYSIDGYEFKVCGEQPFLSYNHPSDIVSNVRQIAIYDKKENGFILAQAEDYEDKNRENCFDGDEYHKEGDAVSVYLSPGVSLYYANNEKIRKVTEIHTHTALAMGFSEADLKKIDKGEISGYIAPPSISDIESLIIVMGQAKTNYARNKIRDIAVDPFGVWEYSYDMNSIENNSMSLLTELTELRQIATDETDTIKKIDGLLDNNDIDESEKILERFFYKAKNNNESQSKDYRIKRIVKNIGTLAIFLKSEAGLDKAGQDLLRKIESSLDEGKKEILAELMKEYPRETKDFLKMIEIQSQPDKIFTDRVQDEMLERLRFYKAVGVEIKYIPLNKDGTENKNPIGFSKKALEIIN